MKYENFITQSERLQTPCKKLLVQATRCCILHVIVEYPISISHSSIQYPFADHAPHRLH